MLRDQRYLLIRRSQHVPAPGMWCFPGGGVEPGETQYAALIRECREELSATIRPIEVVWLWRQPGLVLHWWRVELRCAALIANPAEVSEFAWLSRTELISHPLLLPSNLACLRALADDIVPIAGLRGAAPAPSR